MLQKKMSLSLHVLQLFLWQRAKLSSFKVILIFCFLFTIKIEIPCIYDLNVIINVI